MKLTTPLFLILLLLSFTHAIFAQYDYWPFGTQEAAIRFIDGVAIAEIGHGHLEWENSAAVVDEATGEVIIYTDGIRVYNQQHDTILLNLGACRSAAQPVMVAPVKNTLNQYYIFSNGMGSRCTSDSLFYSKIELLSDGTAAILDYKILLVPNVAENMLLIPTPNDEDYWLVTSERNDTETGSLINRHLVFQVGEQVNLHSDYLSPHPIVASYNSVWSETRQQIAICAVADSSLLILDFDEIEGKITATDTISHKKNGTYDAEWSPDGTKLYFANAHDPVLFQYDFDTENITELHRNEIDTLDGGGLRLGVDGKIYYVHDNRGTTLSIIERPNQAAPNCNFIPDAFELHTPIKSLNLSYTTYVDHSCPNNTDYTGIINNYFPIEEICDNTLIVPPNNILQSGDQVLLIQMQGAEIDTTNTATFGTITDYRNAGRYEFNEIEKVENGKVLLRNAMANAYDLDGGLQLVRVPNLGNATVCQLTCPPWDGKTGGVLAFTGDVIEMQGDIDVSGKGFAGGKYYDAPIRDCLFTASTYFYPASADTLAGEKGVGIAKIMDNLRRGRGAYATGGGGGNDHNTGGGGGSNYSSGGQGGVYFSTNCTVDAPFGFSGYPLSSVYDSENRLFLGGGGGAGHSNNDQGSGGGSGGGIIIVNAQQINSNQHRIRANGSHVTTHFNFPESHDGSGGGGAGGTILLNLDAAIQANLAIEAKGGQGGSSEYRHGHGGGGGGGVLLLNDYPSGGIDLAATGGRSGIGIDGKTNSATDGEDGSIKTGIEIVRPQHRYQPLRIDSITVIAECDATSTIDLTATGGTNIYSFRLNNTSQDTVTTYSALADGNYQIQVADGCWEQDSTVIVQNYTKLIGEAVFTPERCDSLVTIQLLADKGKPPYQYELIGIEKTDNHFRNLFAGEYYWIIRDARGCLVEGVVDIPDISETLNVALPEDFVMQRGKAVQIHSEVSALQERPELIYEWQPDVGLSCTDCPHPIVQPDISTLYTLEVIDGNGCSGAEQILVTVDEVTLYLSTVISPLNRDGKNDYFFPQGDKELIKQVVRFEVFDRWGNQVFTQSAIHINDAAAGWDGTWRGQPLNTGIYTYLIEVELFNEQRQQYKGEVMIR